MGFGVNVAVKTYLFFFFNIPSFFWTCIFSCLEHSCFLNFKNKTATVTSHYSVSGKILSLSFPFFLFRIRIKLYFK